MNLIFIRPYHHIFICITFLIAIPKLTDAWVQTYVEVQEVGIQVGPEDFCDRCNDYSVECNHNNSAMRPRHSHEHNHQYPRYQRTNLDEEDDGYNGSSDNADDDCDEDVKTLHISATSTRLERRKLTNTGQLTLSNITIHTTYFRYLSSNFCTNIYLNYLYRK